MISLDMSRSRKASVGAGAKNIRAKNMYARLALERATVIFNLLARHLTRWSCRASERYNVVVRTGPRSEKSAGPVGQCLC